MKNDLFQINSNQINEYEEVQMKYDSDYNSRHKVLRIDMEKNIARIK